MRHFRRGHRDVLVVDEEIDVVVNALVDRQQEVAHARILRVRDDDFGTEFPRDPCESVAGNERDDRTAAFGLLDDEHRVLSLHVVDLDARHVAEFRSDLLHAFGIVGVHVYFDRRFRADDEQRLAARFEQAAHFGHARAARFATRTPCRIYSRRRAAGA